MAEHDNDNVDELEGLCFNNPGQVSPTSFDYLFATFANAQGFTPNRGNKLNMFIAFSVSGTSPVANYDIKFDGGAVKVSVQDLAVFLGQNSYTLRQFARSGYDFYEREWTHSQALIKKMGGRAPVTTDFAIDDSETAADALVFKAHKQLAVDKKSLPSAISGKKAPQPFTLE